MKKIVSYPFFGLCLYYKASLYFLSFYAFDESEVYGLHPKLESSVKLLIDLCQFCNKAITPRFDSLKLRHRFNVFLEIIETRKLGLGHHKSTFTIPCYFMESFFGLSRS